jgi:benzoate-CoA ligase family protein
MAEPLTRVRAAANVGAMSIAVGPERFNASALIDRNIEAGRGDKPAFHAPDATLTYDELRRCANRAGNLLRELGVRREDRVLMVLDDTTAFPAVFLGAMRIGAVPVPVSPLDKAENFGHFIQDSYARLVVGEAPLVELLRGVAPDDGSVPFVSANGAADGALDLAAAMAGQSDELDPVSTHRDDMAFWLYSSGSTGRPKGVVHLHHDIEITCRCYAGEVLGLGEDDVLFSTTKLYHAYGLGNGLSFPLYFGATAVLLSGPPRPAAIAERLRSHRPTVLFSVPALFALMLREGPDFDDALQSVRFCVSAAEALPPVTFDRWRERFGLEIVDGIGSTEMLHIFCSNRPGAVARGSTGRPVPGYDLRITDDDGAVLGGEAIGNLEVRGDSCAAYYWHQHEKTKSCMRGDWFTTGDRYRRTAEGTYVYEGRTDDMLKVGGLWVSPVDMENCLLEHPAVHGVGVVGVEVEGMSRVAAYVVAAPDRPADDALAAELRDWCRQRLRRYEYPHLVTFVDDLPRTVNGKVQRFALREQAATADA